jgi:drug/metabolite transporter (DMT)-like permease
MLAPQKALVMGTREWMLLLLLSVLWGGSFFLFKVLVAELPPLTIVLGRVGLASLLLNVLLLLRRDPMPASPRLWCSFIVMQAIVGMALIGMGLAAIDGRLWAGRVTAASRRI